MNQVKENEVVVNKKVLDELLERLESSMDSERKLNDLIIQFNALHHSHQTLQQKHEQLIEEFQMNEVEYLELDSISTETKMILETCKRENEALIKENNRLTDELQEFINLYEQSISVIGEQAEEYEALKNQKQGINQEPKKEMSHAVIFNLHEQLLNLGGSEAHCSIEGIQGKKDAIAVISVYHGQRPAHEILENLDTWAKQTEQTKVVEKLNQLTTPLDDVEIPW